MISKLTCSNSKYSRYSEFELAFLPSSFPNSGKLRCLYTFAYREGEVPGVGYFICWTATQYAVPCGALAAKSWWLAQFAGGSHSGVSSMCIVVTNDIRGEVPVPVGTARLIGPMQNIEVSLSVSY